MLKTEVPMEMDIVTTAGIDCGNIQKSHLSLILPTNDNVYIYTTKREFYVNAMFFFGFQILKPSSVCSIWWLRTIEKCDKTKKFIATFVSIVSQL